MPLKLKTVTVENKVYAEVVDGKPVYIHDDGKELPFDADATTTRIASLNREAQTNRESKEALEASLAKFNGANPDDVKKALDTVKNLDDKKLVDAGKVEEIKAAAIKAVEDRFAPVVSERDALKTEIFGERLGNRFNGSKFITEKMSVPPDVVRAVFGKQFKDEGGKPVAYDASGNKMYSRTSPGSDPDFDEAISQMIDAYPFKDTLLKGTGGGSGKKENGHVSTGADGKKQIKRSDWDSMNFSERDNAMKDGGATIVD